MLRTFSHELVADYLDAKPPTPTHDGHARGSENPPPPLLNCPAGAAETQPKSQPIKHNVDNMCDLCRVHWWCDFGPHGLRICLHCRAAAVTNTCAIADDNVYVAAMSTALPRPLDNTTSSEIGASTASLEGGASNGQHGNGTRTANASNNIIDHANVNNHDLKRETSNGEQGSNSNRDNNVLMNTTAGKVAMVVVTPPTVRDDIITHIDRFCGACHRLIIGHGRICFECREDHHHWWVVPCLRCGVLVCVMCSRLHECGGDDINVLSGRPLSLTGDDHRTHTDSVATPVSGMLPTSEIPCQLHSSIRCNKGDECNLAHLPATAANTHKSKLRTWRVKMPTRVLWQPRKLPKFTGACKCEVKRAHTNDNSTNMATPTAKGKAVAEPRVESKIHKLRIGAVPGTWTTVDNPRAQDHSHLSNEGWAAAHSKPQQRTAQQITGPRYFSPGLVDATDSTDSNRNHTDDLPPVGNLTAASPKTQGLDQVKAPACRN